MTESQINTLLAIFMPILGSVATYLLLRATLSTKAVFAEKEVTVNAKQAVINTEEVAAKAETADIDNRKMATQMAANNTEKLWDLSKQMHDLERQSWQDKADKTLMASELVAVRTELIGVKASLAEAREEIKTQAKAAEMAAQAASLAFTEQGKLLKEAYDLIKKQSEQIETLVQAKTTPEKEAVPVVEIPLTQAEMKTNDAANLVQATADVKSEGLISNV